MNIEFKLTHTKN